MRLKSLSVSRLLDYLLAACVAVSLVFSSYYVFNTIQLAVKQLGTTERVVRMYDAYCFWYMGQYIRQGSDPFEQFALGIPPRFPIQHVDGGITAEILDRYKWCTNSPPPYTPPVMLIYTLLSFFSWHIASGSGQLFMLGVHTALGFCLYLYFHRVIRTFHLVLLTIIISITLSLFSAREAANAGQPLMISLLLMIVSLMAARQRWDLTAGLALGIALSKYQVALPLAMLFFVQRRWRVLATAAVVQIVSIVLLSALVNISPITMINHYIDITIAHLPQDINSSSSLIHLASFISSGFWVLLTTAFVLTVLLLVPAFPAFRRVWTSRVFVQDRLAESLLLALLMGWCLLAVYHMNYDGTMILFIIIPLTLISLNMLDVPLSALEKIGLRLLLLVGFLVALFPEYTMRIIPRRIILMVSSTLVDQPVPPRLILFTFTLYTLALTIVTLIIIRRLEKQRASAPEPAPSAAPQPS